MLTCRLTVAEYLFHSDLKLGKIEAGITYDKLSDYNVFIIGVPVAESYLSSEEIDHLTRYVKDGGSLLVVKGHCRSTACGLGAPGAGRFDRDPARDDWPA